MLSFLIKRLGSLVLVLFLMLTGMFVLLHLAPSSPVNSLPRPSRQTRQPEPPTRRRSGWTSRC